MVTLERPWQLPNKEWKHTHKWLLAMNPNAHNFTQIGWTHSRGDVAVCTSSQQQQQSYTYNVVTLLTFVVGKSRASESRIGWSGSSWRRRRGMFQRRFDGYAAWRVEKRLLSSGLGSSFQCGKSHRLLMTYPLIMTGRFTHFRPPPRKQKLHVAAAAAWIAHLIPNVEKTMILLYLFLSRLRPPRLYAEWGERFSVSVFNNSGIFVRNLSNLARSTHSLDRFTKHKKKNQVLFVYCLAIFTQKLRSVKNGHRIRRFWN